MTHTHQTNSSSNPSDQHDPNNEHKGNHNDKIDDDENEKVTKKHKGKFEFKVSYIEMEQEMIDNQTSTQKIIEHGTSIVL